MDNRDRDDDSVNGGSVRADHRQPGAPDSGTTAGEVVGGTVGGVGGVLAGAGIGSIAGPVGTVIGAIAGALGGWWSGKSVADATDALSNEDEKYYREIWEGTADRPADRSFDDARPAYYLGHVAAHNPDYADRDWNKVQQDLSRGWNDEHAKRYGSWESVTSFVAVGYERERDRLAGKSRSTANAGEGTFDRAPTHAEIRNEERNR